MKIRGKLLLSFGLFALLGVVVGGVGLVTSGRYSALVEETQAVGSFNMEIKDLAADHLKWREQLSSAFVQNSPAVEAQADGHKCNLGKLLYGERLETLATHDPELGTRLNALKEPHQELHETVKAIVADYRQVHPGLSTTLLSRLDDHNAWAAAVTRQMMDSQPLNVQLDPTRCGFGKWLEGSECQTLCRDWPAFATKLEGIRAVHDDLHASARLIEAAPDQAGKQGIFKTKSEPALASVRSGFNELIAMETALETGRRQALETFNGSTAEILGKVGGQLQEIVEYGKARNQEMTAQMAAMRKQQALVISATLLCLLIASAVLGWVLSQRISRPIAKAVALAEQIGRGDTSQRLQSESKDETGQLAQAMNRMAESLEAKAVLAGRIAEGDLTAEVVLASEKDRLGLALRTMVAKLTDLVGQIQQGATEMEASTSQIASASQELASGASESAASLEEISSALVHLNQKVAENASGALRSKEQCQTVRGIVETAESSIENMNQAMQRINAGSQEIGKVIKVIDDIAFQTNLLALNAAVEAARAGKHGKGFAVVAEEVRNLAGRSAKAARETSTMITESIQRAGEGSNNLQAVNASFSGISEGMGVIVELVDEIAASSQGQARGLSEITQGTGLLDSATQRNSASSEETAAAAQELSGVAARISELTRQFVIKRSTGPQPVPAAASAPPVRRSGGGGSGWVPEREYDRLPELQLT